MSIPRDIPVVNSREGQGAYLSALEGVGEDGYPASFDALTEIEHYFVVEYCANGCTSVKNAMLRVVEAGVSKCSEKRADASGRAILSRARVKGAIRDYRSLILEKITMSQGEFVSILVNMVRGVPLGEALNADGSPNMDFLKSHAAKDLFDSISMSNSESDGGGEGGSSVSKSVSLKTNDRLKAMTLLMKVMGWDGGGKREESKVTVNVNIPSFGGGREEKVIEMNEHPALKGGTDDNNS